LRRYSVQNLFLLQWNRIADLAARWPGIPPSCQEENEQPKQRQPRQRGKSEEMSRAHAEAERNTNDAVEEEGDKPDER
jgi:hypothetical protein